VIVAAKIIGGARLDAREGDFDGVLTGADFCTAGARGWSMLTLLLVGIVVSLPP